MRAQCPSWSAAAGMTSSPVRPYDSLASTMNPELMRAAQAAMHKMTPEQIAAMQSQMSGMNPSMFDHAMKQMSSMTPEQIQEMTERMQKMSPDEISRATTQAQAQASAQNTYQLNGATQLKADGNKLVAEGRYHEAKDKYQRAISNLLGVADDKAALVRQQCTLNLALCYLKTQDYGACVQECNNILRSDARNVKALARRGQAKIGLEDFTGAVADLRKALQLSPEDTAIENSLQQAEKGMRESGQPEPAAAPEAPPAKRAGALGDDEGEITVDEESSASARGAGGPPASSTGPTAPGMPRADELQRAAEAMRSNPQMMQSYMEMLSNMTQEQIDAMVASTGQTLPGGQRLTPELARTMAEQLKTMTPDQWDSFARMAGSMPGGMPGGPFPTAPATGAVGGGSGGAVPGMGAAAGMEAMMQNPEMRRMAVQSMRNMTPEQFKAMSGAMGQRMSDAQVKATLEQFKRLSDDQLEAYMKYAGMAHSAFGAVRRYAWLIATVAALLLFLLAYWIVRRWRRGATPASPAPVAPIAPEGLKPPVIRDEF